MPDEREIDRAELLELYKIVVDEVRFEVNLNWQRTQYYFTVNTAVIAVAASIFKVGGLDTAFFVAVVFGLGWAVARVAKRMIAHGHTYYRRAVYKKTLIEHLLGRFQPVGGFAYSGANLALATTEGMSDANDILENPDRYIRREPSIGTVTHRLLVTMRIFMIVDAAGVIMCIALAISRIWLRQ